MTTNPPHITGGLDMDAIYHRRTVKPAAPTATTTAKPTHINRRGRALGPDATAVLAAVRKFPHGVTATGLAGALETLPPDLAKTLGNLRQQGYLVNTAERGASAVWVCSERATDMPPARTPKLTTPQNGPGHTPPKRTRAEGPSKLQKQWVAGQPVVQPQARSATASMFERPTYKGAELRTYTDRPGANDHMQCGTVVNGQWKPYTPPGPMCVGAAGPMPLQSGQPRFAK